LPKSGNCQNCQRTLLHAPDPRAEQRRALITNGEVPDAELFLSPVVSREIVIQVARGTLTLTRSVNETLDLAFEKFGMKAQTVTHIHTIALGDLPRFIMPPLTGCLLHRSDARTWCW